MAPATQSGLTSTGNATMEASMKPVGVWQHVNDKHKSPNIINHGFWTDNLLLHVWNRQMTSWSEKMLQLLRRMNNFHLPGGEINWQNNTFACDPVWMDKACMGWSFFLFLLSVKYFEKSIYTDKDDEQLVKHNYICNFFIYISTLF